MRPRLLCYDLHYAKAGLLKGYRCVHDGTRYRETPVVLLVDDLPTLPPTARIYVESARWRA